MQLDPRTLYSLHVAMVLVALLASSVSWTSFFSATVALGIMQGLVVLFGVLSFMVNGVTPPPKVAAFLAMLMAGVLLFGGEAAAQAPRPLTGNPVRDFGLPQPRGPIAQTELDLVSKLQALSLADFKYALALAQATKNVVSIPCWQAWVDLITAQQEGVKNPDGTPMIEPDPHLITNVERMSELLANLRPDSPISTSCAALAGAAGKDASALVGGILSGGALGLFKLPVPIP